MFSQSLRFVHCSCEAEITLQSRSIKHVSSEWSTQMIWGRYGFTSTDLITTFCEPIRVTQLFYVNFVAKAKYLYFSAFALYFANRYLIFSDHLYVATSKGTYVACYKNSEIYRLYYVMELVFWFILNPSMLLNKFCCRRMLWLNSWTMAKITGDRIVSILSLTFIYAVVIEFILI